MILLIINHQVIKLGWMEGVLMPCLLNIWGTMLFLRLTWVVGQAGIWQGLAIITLANSVTVLSAISMSAIATNGQIAGTQNTQKLEYQYKRGRPPEGLKVADPWGRNSRGFGITITPKPTLTRNHSLTRCLHPSGLNPPTIRV